VTAPPERPVAVGLIARAHGVDGEVAVQPLTEVEARFQPGSVLLLGPEGERTLTVGSVRGPHRGRLLVRFREIGEREEAEALTGRVLVVRPEDVPSIEENGRYWVHHVVGLQVETEGGRPLGRVREVLQNPANDIWVAEGESGDVLIPAVRDIVIEVDVQGGRVVIREVPGLIPGTEEA
jgi:16S rRNA processing protein RimM